MSNVEETAKSLQERLDCIEIRTISSDIPGFVGKLDLSRHPGLENKIRAYKWNESVNLGYDIGLVSATLGYFADNPAELLKPEFSYLFEKSTNGDDSPEYCMNLKEANLLQGLTMLIALNKNKYYRSEEAHSDVGESDAEKDFNANRSKDWGERTRKALCALCSSSPSCKVGQKNLYELLKNVPGSTSIPVSYEIESRQMKSQEIPLAG